MFLSWKSVRYASGLQKLSGLFLIDYEFLSFMFFFVTLDLLLLLLSK